MLLLQLLFERSHNFEWNYFIDFNIYIYKFTFINFRYFLQIENHSLSRESVALQFQRLSQTKEVLDK